MLNVEHPDFSREGIGSSPNGITEASAMKPFFMPQVYILYSASLNKYYIGACIDMDRRLKEHNAGHSTFTKTGIPWKLVYQETFDSLQEAKKRELYIKKQKSRQYIERLIAQR